MYLFILRTIGSSISWARLSRFLFFGEYVPQPVGPLERLKVAITLYLHLRIGQICP